LQARTPEPWLHVPRYLNGKGVVARGGDFAKLVHWGLLEAKGGERADGSSRIGYYRLTPEGVEFVENRRRVPTHLYFYNSEVLGQETKTISMPEALGEHFDYEELMAARGKPPKPPKAKPTKVPKSPKAKPPKPIKPPKAKPKPKRTRGAPPNQRSLL
jgi:hypothetical protein